jgi:hypothetical protein
MQLLKLFRTASSAANALVISAMILLLVKIFFINRLPEYFAGGYELGVIVEAVLASVVASYIFYLLVVHVKEQTDREILRPYIEKHSKRIVGDCLSQLDGISSASNVKLKFFSLTSQDITSAFTNIAPYSPAPMILSPQSMQNANWFQYFVHHQHRTKESIRKLLDQLPFLDTELVRIITEIDDCPHFYSTQVASTIAVKNTNIVQWSKSFYEYISLCKTLNTHIIRLGFSSAVS